MATLRTCKWCGKEYDWAKSAAKDRNSYCCQKCETDAKAKK